MAPTMTGSTVSSRRFVAGAMYGVKGGGPSGLNPIRSGYSTGGRLIRSRSGVMRSGSQPMHWPISGCTNPACESV